MTWLPLVVLAAILATLPLPFGGVLVWCHLVLQVAAFLCLVLVAIRRAPLRGWRRVRWPAGALAVLAGLGLLQSVRWPAWLVEGLSPSHAEMWRLAHPEAASIPLSLAPATTGFYSLTWLAVAVLMVCAAALARRSAGARLLLWAALASLAVQVLYGARLWLEGTGTIWGLQIGGGARFRGTFINPDHFALYLEILLAVLLAWGWWAVRRTRRFVDLDRRVLYIAPAVILWLMTFAVLAFSGSRAGILAAVVATAAQGLVLMARQRHWLGGAAGVLAPVVGLAVVASIGLQAGLGRWLGTSTADLTWNARFVAWDAALDLWRSFPVLGTGLASFREAFPLVQPADLPGRWLHAHNDWLELGVVLGAVGWLVLALGVGALLVGLAGALQQAERSEDRAMVLAAMGACVAVMVHSCVDFGLTMPANAVTLAVLCGFALGAGDESNGGETPASGGRPAVER